MNIYQIYPSVQTFICGPLIIVHFDYQTRHKQFIMSQMEDINCRIHQANPHDQCQMEEEQSQDTQYVFYNIYSPTSKIQCCVCKKDISKHTKILAFNSDFCPACFSKVRDFPEVYHIVNKLDYPLYDEEWTADEELLMFEGLQKHGFGNWSEIAQFIGTGKTRQQVENHYTYIYLQSPDFLPTNRQILSKRDEITQRLNKDSIQKIVKPKSRLITSNTKNQRGHLTLNTQNNSTVKIGTNPAEIIGYMPRRGDFQVQYDNQAELLLAQMEFNQEDTVEEVQMKFRLIEIYNYKLSERIKRKEFVIQRNLLDLKEKAKIDKTRTKEEKQIYSMMRVFARFHSPEEHEKLVQGILREKMIRQRIEELKELKKRGFKTLADVEEELEAKRKKQEKIRRKQQNSFPSNYDPSKTRRAAKVPGIDREKRSTHISKQQDDLCKKFNLSIKTYIRIKQRIVEDSVKLGILHKQDTVNKLYSIDRGTVESIFDYLVEKQEIIGA